MKTLKTVSDFYNFFARIPSNLWTTGEFKHGARCCAYGHLGSNNMRDTSSARAFSELTHCRGADINDGKSLSSFYDVKSKDLGNNAKERILNALVLKEAGLWDFAAGRSNIEPVGEE